MFDVITIGTVTRDAFVRSAAFQILEDARFRTGKAECLNLGSKVDIDELIFATGGGATNTAVTFARHGFRTACVCRAGDDLGGEEAIEELQGEKINTDFIIRDKKHSTAYSLILSSMSGERTILVYRGASKYFQEKEIVWDKLNAKWFYITHLSDESASIFLPILDFAKKNNIKVAVNPGSTQIKLGVEKWKGILKKIDLVILNREEAGELTGIDYKDIKNIFRALDDLMGGIAVMTD
ncbi:MAG: carbohydrate kinase family protein, partial [Patescibacteria group bacterium]